MKWLTYANLNWLRLYVVLIFVALGSLRAVRSWAIESFDSREAQEDWGQWRSEAEKHSQGEGPVSRREIEHTSPPTLLLLRDHYATCQATVLILGSVLYFSFMFLLRGVFSSKADEEKEETPQ